MNKYKPKPNGVAIMVIIFLGLSFMNPQFLLIMLLDT